VHAHAIDHGANSLQIWIPAAAAGIIRVTDHVPERRPLAANLAFHCHDNSSPILTMLNKANSLAEFRPIRTRFDSLEDKPVSHNFLSEFGPPSDQLPENFSSPKKKLAGPLCGTSIRGATLRPNRANL
jgi:hypothetical protein